MQLEQLQLQRKERPSDLPIVIGAIVFPLSVLFWVLNHFLHIFVTHDDTDDIEYVPPNRWLIAIGFSVAFTLHGFRKKSLDKSGALSALAVGFFLTLSSYCFLASLLIFFLTSSKATKFRSNRKRLMEYDFKEGGQRNWVQVICNGGMATELAILYLMDVGHGQFPVDFGSNYRASWLGMGVLGALSCANGDTWASELGSVMSEASPRLITSLRKVPKGTNGAVSLAGLLFSLIGGFVVGLGYYLTVLMTTDTAILYRSPPQWPIIIAGTIGGFFGSLLDSVLGATLQYSGADEQGIIHERPAPNLKRISGASFFDNHSVNLISTTLMGLFMPGICKWLWHYVQAQ